VNKTRICRNPLITYFYQNFIKLDWKIVPYFLPHNFLHDQFFAPIKTRSSSHCHQIKVMEKELNSDKPSIKLCSPVFKNRDNLSDLIFSIKVKIMYYYAFFVPCIGFYFAPGIDDH
jgi:hypothetical protein